MKIKLKANKQGQIYLPKSLREQWGNVYVLIPNVVGGYIYIENAGAKGALKSLDVVKRELEHRAELEEKS